MYLVFSDVDGTVLDFNTYSSELSREGIELLRERGIPLVLVSSKTLPEMKAVQSELNLSTPFVFENGGGISLPGEDIEYLGMSVAELSGYLPVVRRVMREEIRIITEMTVDEVIGITGMSRERAVYSQQRTTSLPFVISSKKKYTVIDIERCNEGLMPHGIEITKGGRFFHLLSMAVNKGNAVRRVTRHYLKNDAGSIVTAAIGDSENDISMLREVDIPIAVRKYDGSAGINGISNLFITDGIGPSGFTEAVSHIINHIQQQEKS